MYVLRLGNLSRRRRASAAEMAVGHRLSANRIAKEWGLGARDWRLGEETIRQVQPPPPSPQPLACQLHVLGPNRLGTGIQRKELATSRLKIEGDYKIKELDIEFLTTFAP